MINLYSEVDGIKMLITPELLKAAIPKIKQADAWAQAFNIAVHKFPVNDIPMMLAQLGHESVDLTRLEENLNYSAKRLTQVWPRRYPTIEAARPYARNPEALANHTYGGRLGNTMKGDGWKFRGRGPIMVTGRYNYDRLKNDTGLPVLTHPELLAKDKEAGAISACWYMNVFVTGTTIEAVTRDIQGGQLGLTDRNARYIRALRVYNRK